MCGILFHNFRQNVNNPLFHRGPDGNGQVELNGWKMHHSRLSVQDTSDASSQPYSKLDEAYLVYNGEIYNNKELRSEYFAMTKFTTTGDTELLYHILLSERYDLLDKIEGIFAFVFYHNSRVVYARDPFGVKPLFKFSDGKNFALSSELATFFEFENLVVNDEYLPEIVKYKFVGLGNTIYRNVTKVLPGRLYIKDESGISEHTYSTVFDNIDADRLYDDDEILFDIKSTVECQLLADVEVGLQLSGGIDSTLLAKFIPQKTKIFSSIFSEDYDWDELRYINKVLERYGLKNINIPFGKQYFEKNLSSVFYRRGGISHPHTIAIEQIAQEASRHVKVLLSGEGADEMFLGYDRYMNIKKPLEVINNGEFFTNKELCNFFNWTSEDENRANHSRTMFINNFAGSLKANLQMLEINFHLSNLLERQDLATMKYSIEGRVPFLGQSFSRKMLSLPYKQLVGKTGKLPLKRIINLEFGKEFAYRKKIGFRVPVNEWMYTDFCYDLIVSIIKTNDIVNLYFKKNILDDICKRNGVYHDPLSYGKLFWTILNLGKI